MTDSLEREERRQRHWVACAWTVFGVVIVGLMAGCATPGAPRPADGLGLITGPDAAAIEEDAGNLLAKFGEREKIGSIIGEHEWTRLHHHTADGEPISCTDDGCFAGMTRITETGTMEFRWPFGRKRGVVRHEAMHAVLSTLERWGVIEPTYGDPHPDTVTIKATNRQVDVRRIVNWRWPDAVNPLSPKENGAWDDYSELCAVGLQ